MQKKHNTQVLDQLLAHEHQLRVEAEQELKSLQQKVKALEQELLEKENAFQKRLRLVTDSLRQSELAYRQMVEAAGDLVCKFTPLGKVTYINQQGCLKLGRRAAEVLNEDIVEFIPKAWRDSFWRQVRQQMEARELCRYYQVPFLSKDQHFIWTDLQVSLILEESNILELACVAKDVTEQKQAEEKLKRTQTRLSALIKNLHSGALVKNEEDSVILANEMFCHIFRMFINPEWLIGKPLESLFEHIHKAFADEDAFLEWAEAARQGKQEQINQPWMLKDGRLLRIDYVPIFEDGQFLGSLWNFRDVTEEEKAQQTIRANEEKYRTVIQRMQLGLIELDGDGRIT
ncbi:MAG: PAS domain S-box protein, partial [Deltaproteobacteria bacterium]